MLEIQREKDDKIFLIISEIYLQFKLVLLKTSALKQSIILTEIILKSF